MIRFKAVRAAWIMELPSRLADLASEYGYSDQAHLSRQVNRSLIARRVILPQWHLMFLNLKIRILAARRHTR
jgi:hypothetical protein